MPYIRRTMHIFIILIMSYKKGHADRPRRSHLSRRVVGVIIACALLFLIWFNAGNEGHLRKTFNSLSKQKEQSPALASVSDERSDVDAQSRNAISHLKNTFSQAPNPTLPPPDNEEYMAMCMAGEYL